MSELMAEAREVPVAENVKISELFKDPYPTYQKLRAESAIHWVPEVNRFMVLSFEACHTMEQDAERFSANETNSMMKRAMGHSMLRKDDPEHAAERKSYGSVLRPRTVMNHWKGHFAENFQTYLKDLIDAGPGADLVEVFAGPYAAENLRNILGFDNAATTDIVRWSQALMDGTGNYADDPEVWAANERANHEINIAIDEMLAYRRENPDSSLLSQFATIDFPIETIRANINIAIGGGLNEPRDAIGTTVWALLTHPGQLQQVLADDRWSDAFDESVRWVAPISMYPREATCETVVDGLVIPEGARLGIVVGAANRDPKVFDDPESYDINREKKPHLAFGGGSHHCAGIWAARAMCIDVALPGLFKALPRLRLDPENPAEAGGWVFRGMQKLPVLWG